MNAKKLCCLITITSMLFFGLPAIPFANVDRGSQLSQEELGLVFQKSDGTWNGKPEFLKYLDEKEMKETEGKAVAAVPAVARIGQGTVVGAIVGAVEASKEGKSVIRGAIGGAISGAISGAAAFRAGQLFDALGSGPIVRWIGETAIIAAGAVAGGSVSSQACGNYCHSIRLQGEH